MPGEFDFIQWIRSHQKRSVLIPLPAGDDMAVVKWPTDDLLLVGTDQVLDGVHFDSAAHSPNLIGQKVMNRNLSDCAAMACLPVAAVATVALPKTTNIDYAKQLYLGMREAADRFDCQIIGGDTATWPGKLVVTVTLLGRADGIQPITRSGAKAGDLIYVTGPLGGSILGRHMTFVPRIKLARELAATGLVTSMIDISDGISRDIRHICQESKVGAIIDASAIPIHIDAIEMRRDGHSPLEHALHDGEDHELLLTSRNKLHMLAGTIIGQITADPAIVLKHGDIVEPLEPKGWEHRF